MESNRGEDTLAIERNAPEANSSFVNAAVLFDGVCNLCHGSVLFIVDRDPKARFRFASLQSDEARALLEPYSPKPADLSSVLLIENGALYDRSTAALRIARRLKGFWPLMFALIVIPKPLRDAVYRIIARNRYRWFGRTESCRIPTPELSGRFIGRA